MRSWKAKFKTLEGWFVDDPSFASESEAVAYCLAMAHRFTNIVDFSVIGRRRPANSCSVRRG